MWIVVSEAAVNIDRQAGKLYIYIYKYIVRQPKNVLWPISQSVGRYVVVVLLSC